MHIVRTRPSLPSPRDMWISAWWLVSPLCRLPASTTSALQTSTGPAGARAPEVGGADCRGAERERDLLAEGGLRGAERKRDLLAEGGLRGAERERDLLAE